MFREILELIGYRLRKIVTSRLFPLTLIFLALFSALFLRIYRLQVQQGEEARRSVNESMIRTVPTEATRGTIYDVRGVPLAYNRLRYDVTVRDDGSYADGYERNLMILRLIAILEEHGETVLQSIPLALDEAGQLTTTFSSEASRLRFLRDIYGLRNVSDLTQEQRDSTAWDIYQHFRELFGIGSYRNGSTYLVSTAHALKCIYIRYSMYTNYYVRYNAVTAAQDIAPETVAALLEHAPELLGVEIRESYTREYNNALYFSHIIGYTGQISAEEIEAMNEAGGSYATGDVIGKAGIEASMEEILCGTKGFQRIYVNNVGQVQSVIETVDPVSGNDVYLSVDSRLQIAIYFLLQQKLTGILIDNLINGEVEDPAEEHHYIPIRTAYNQLISNNVLDYTRFSLYTQDTASWRLDTAFREGRTEVLEELEQELTSYQPTAYRLLDGPMRNYMDAVYKILLDEEILLADKVELTSDRYLRYRREGSISLAEFLRGALEAGWIDTSVLPLDSKYTTSEQVYRQMVDLVLGLLTENRDFSKAVYEELIRDGRIDLCDLGLALFEQGVIAYNAEDVAELENGDGDTAFEFLVRKINSIEITPAQLALDPCSASASVVDPATGKVLAMVAYPGYDNNRISDPDYYASLLEDQSSPLFNSATQAQAAPGSVFKLVTSAAALETETVEPDTVITTEGVFTEAGMHLECSVYPRNHGDICLWEALRDSCNDYFCRVAYQFSFVDDVFSDTKGLEIIQDYAARLGLGKKSGVEVSEYAPQISRTSAIASAIGQGSHLYSNIQLADYVTAIATRGTVYDLTLLDHTARPDGTLIQSFRGTLIAKAQFDGVTWDNMLEGMHKAATDGATAILYSGNVDLACKTGTAEESKNRPDHASFICFAPFDSPQVCVSVSIFHGYSSGNTADLGGSILDYYFGFTEFEDIITRDAGRGGNDIQE